MAAPAKPKLPKGRHASQIKRQRQTLKRTARNTLIRSEVRTSIKKVREALAKKDPKLAKEALTLAIRNIKKAVSKGVFHPNNGSRKVSRLSKLVTALSR